MVGSVRDAADLVVTDPLQAGVMAVMAIADTAKFDIARQRGKTLLSRDPVPAVPVTATEGNNGRRNGKRQATGRRQPADGSTEADRQKANAEGMNR